MEEFKIMENEFLHSSIDAYYHADYTGGGKWQIDGTIENLICTLKNDITPYSNIVLENAVNRLEVILRKDLPAILNKSKKSALVVCVVPRAKVNYLPNQLLFKKTVGDVVDRLPGLLNGCNFITRHTDTKTTHLLRGTSNGGTGSVPYIGITQNTCSISAEVTGKDILLIDDLYTRTINIDEDAIQALLDRGASSVRFYSVGRTVSRT